MRRVLLPLLLVLVGCAQDIRYREDVDAKPEWQGVEHIRYNGKDDIAGTMQTAVEHWKDGKGHHVALVGVIHIGDAAYYAAIQKALAQYDEALFELVKPAEMPKSEISKDAPDMYDPMARIFGLVAQGRHIEYRKANFTWLDMSAETFAARMGAVVEAHMPKILASLGLGEGAQKKDRKEVRAMVRKAAAKLARRLNAKGKRALAGALMTLPPGALASAEDADGEGGLDVMAVLLKALMAPLRLEKAIYQRRGRVRMFEDKYQHMLALSSATEEEAVELGLEGEFGEAVEGLITALGRVVLEERDAVVVEGLKARLKAGTLKKKTAVFYGAAHLPGIGKGLKAMGFERTGRTWMTAIEITKPASK